MEDQDRARREIPATNWSGPNELLDHREIVEVSPVRHDLPVAEIGDGDAGNAHASDASTPPRRRGRAAPVIGLDEPFGERPVPHLSSPRKMMTTLENASSRRAASPASACSPDTIAYGDHPTTSSVNSVFRSTGAPATSASSAVDSTSLRDSLIAAPIPVVDFLNVLLAIRAPIRSRGCSPWPPRTLRLSARPTRVTAQGARARQPGPPEAVHTPTVPGPGRLLLGGPLIVSLLFLGGSPSLVVSHRPSGHRSGHEGPPPCPSPESHRQPFLSSGVTYDS